MKTDHIVFDITGKDPRSKHFLCLHCGHRDPLSMPISITQFSLLTRDFIKKHRRCPKPKP